MQSADYWIEKLGLLAHPEGGFYKETYKSSDAVSNDCLPDRFSGNRVFSTGIFFLLKSGHFSAFHKIQSDEMWHFYEGHTLEIVYIDHTENLQIIKLGRNLDNGEVLQAVVPANTWFGSFLPEQSDYALVGCTVSPGFDFQDFELADRKVLTNLYPQFSDIIAKLTH
ncbi:MAG TPA: cupin domain-containing protein [Leadbetterella sp.]|nr:cupin domain-containing protein [Leadbetterella sp.]